MNTSSAKSADSGTWKRLYRAALLELDETKLPERIARAEKALALRAHRVLEKSNNTARTWICLASVELI